MPIWNDPELMVQEIERLSVKHRLTRRETEVYGLLANNVIQCKDIALRLGLSLSTVNNHIKSLFDKTGTHSKSELLSTLLRHVTKRLRLAEPLGQKLKVLLIDDDRALCEVVTLGLNQMGFQATAVSDPEEALESVASLNPDVVVCDVHMPRIDGFSVLKSVRQAHAHFPVVILMSGVYNPELLDQVLGCGASGLLRKPVNLEKLAQMIREQFTCDRTRPLSPDDAVTRIPEPLELGQNEIGFGGIFVPLPLRTQAQTIGTAESLASLPERALVSLNFRLAGEPLSVAPIHAIGSVAWTRKRSQGDLQRGTGIRFVRIGETDLRRVQKYVYRNQILSFVPEGARRPA